MERHSGIGTNTTLHRALDVLEALARAGRTQSLAQIVERVDLPKPTVHRLLTTLVERGYAARADDNAQGYRLGPRCYQFGSLTTRFRDLRDAAEYEMTRLNRASGELMALAVYDEGCAVYVDTREGTHPVCCASNVGFRAHAACVSTGRALLAFQAETEISRVLATRIPQYTPKTIVSVSELRRLLDAVRHDGFATNFGSYRDEVGGVSAAVRDRAGVVVASIGFCVPEHRMDAAYLPWLKHEILRASSRISSGLGSIDTHGLGARAENGNVERSTQGNDHRNFRSKRSECRF